MRKVLGISMDAKTWQRIDADRGLVKRSNYIEYMVKKAMDHPIPAE